MSGTTGEKYRLYAAPLVEASISAAEKARFSRVTATPAPGYVLIYTDGASPKGAMEITPDKTELLSVQDATWLVESNMRLAEERIQANSEAFLRDMSEKMTALESELKKQKEEMEKRGGIEDGR